MSKRTATDIAATSIQIGPKISVGAEGNELACVEVEISVPLGLIALIINCQSQSVRPNLLVFQKVKSEEVSQNSNNAYNFFGPQLNPGTGDELNMLNLDKYLYSFMGMK